MNIEKNSEPERKNIFTGARKDRSAAVAGAERNNSGGDSEMAD